ncbi:MAG: hypothetical protein AAFO07_21830, partial [Bacteroidota bacterium]
MKNQFFLLSIALFLLLTVNLNAQEYKVAMSSGKVIINEVNRVDIEGYSGSEVIIISDEKKSDDKEDSRAKGLKEISASGHTDNTGVGLAAEKDGNELVINQLSRNNKNRYTIKVPNGVAVYYEHSSWEGKTINVKNLSSELEISANYNSIMLENVTGPMSVNTVYGGIDGKLNAAPKNDIMLHSVYKYVDLTIPSGTKGN